VFARDAVTGALTFLEMVRENQDVEEGLDQVTSVAVSPDGTALYATAQGDRAVTVFRVHAALARALVRCGAEPRPGCLEPVTPLAAQVRVRDASAANKDTFRFIWRAGTVTAGDLGDPLTSTDYALCVYDLSSSPAPGFVTGTVAPAGTVCDGSPCWKASGGSGGFRYRDKRGAQGATVTLHVKPDATGKARATVKAKGAELGSPVLPPALPLLVQLQASDAACLQATFDTGGVRQSTAVSFRAAGD
jgi:hypothetical protein